MLIDGKGLIIEEAILGGSVPSPNATNTNANANKSKDGQSTLTTAQSPTYKKPEMTDDSSRKSVIFEGEERVIRIEDVLPPQPKPAGGRLTQFVEG